MTRNSMPVRTSVLLGISNSPSSCSRRQARNWRHRISTCLLIRRVLRCMRTATESRAILALMTTPGPWLSQICRESVTEPKAKLPRWSGNKRRQTVQETPKTKIASITRRKVYSLDRSSLLSKGELFSLRCGNCALSRRGLRRCRR